MGGPYVGGPYAPRTPGGPGATHRDPAPYGDRSAPALGGSTPAGRPTPGSPRTPGTPEALEAPETPGALRTPGTPGAFGTPGTPDARHGRGTPGISYNPSTRGTPQAADTPHPPVTPRALSTPHTPVIPGAPSTPPTPDTPTTPPGPASPYSPQEQGGSPGGGSYGQWNPYASSPTMSYQGSAPTPPYAGGQGPTYPGGPGAIGGGARHGGPRRRPVGAVVVLVVAVLMVVAGGVWAVTSLDDGKGAAATKKASPSASSAGVAYPYGEDVGLKKALRTGDCVHAVWTGTAFVARPGLKVVSCAHGVPDGQVMAVDTARDFADARDHGAERCADRTKATAGSLADAGVYALTPTEAGFRAAGGGTACLVLGRHVPIGGEIGRFRSTGSNVWTTEMSIGDCWLYVDHKTYFTANLTDCADQHTDQVIGFVTAPRTMVFEDALRQGNKLCGDRFESTWAPGADRSVFGYLSDESNWKAGFYSVVCTVGRADRSRTSGAISSSGTTA